jgi:hypothetical protein
MARHLNILSVDRQIDEQTDKKRGKEADMRKGRMEGGERERRVCYQCSFFVFKKPSGVERGAKQNPGVSPTKIR